MEECVEGRRYAVSFALSDGQCEVVFYGRTEEGPAAAFIYGDVESPEEAGDAVVQTICITRKFNSAVPYSTALALLNLLTDTFVATGWQPVASDGPFVGSFVDGLAADWLLEEAEPMQNVGDVPFNTADSCIVQLCRAGTEPVFELDELEDVLRLAAETVGHTADPGRDQLASGELVHVPPGVWMKLSSEVQANLREALAQIWSLGQAEIATEVNLGRMIGENDCVATSDADVEDGRVFYARVGHNRYHHRFVVGVKPKETDTLSIILSRDRRDAGAYTLRTSYLGGLTPPLPGNTGAHRRDGDAEASLAESRAFWASHALAACSFGRAMSAITAEVPPEFIDEKEEEGDK